MLKTWRAEWAHHQNRELERHGHEARVDHRSYEERGIDREATQHRGPVADDMEKNGKPSRIGDENREVEERNAQRAMERVELIRATAELAQQEAKAERGEKHSQNATERQEDRSTNDNTPTPEKTLYEPPERSDEPPSRERKPFNLPHSPPKPKI